MPSYQIICEARVDTPRDRVWAVIADFGAVANSSPLIQASHLTSEASGGVGATRHCDIAMMGATTEEKIVEWVEGETLGIEITSITRMPIMGEQSANFQLEDDGTGTKVKASLSYSVKFGPLGSLAHAMMLKGRLNKGWRSYVAGIKYYAETGNNVDQKTELPVDAVTVTA